MATQVEPVPSQIQPKELSFLLPKALHTTAHIHLTALETCAMVFITTSTPGDNTGSAKPMGSFVYAMPDRINPKSVLSTTLYTSSSIEFTTRLAKILARRMARPVYVGCSLDPGALGLMVEEEMEGLGRIVDVVMEQSK
ncbi:proteasome assembly chaperone 4 family protein [Aspergillus glaucus CBS 516.65]|uniref:Proteasome assembly chaperone 3 n=1 Tax=Aspergillus glaucus CBS 516.65 TaxID=1160497 RepID=A0A1L9VUX2_ASPGL|nr:hypothetical protein ASPGLDRAFT_117992 [Aspergillus glaucus CBS 516.65]OJJ87699.1 hypothetical protein ASPGLDRAFT_117992 [Aspergillus glaucus CBS 516.65]